jgi:toxin HigB-1
VSRDTLQYALIRSFADKDTERLFLRGRSRRLPPDIEKRAKRKLDDLDGTASLGHLGALPGNRLHVLQGNRFGQFAVAVNDQWRICFRFHDGDAFDVEVCDYH